MNIFNKIKSIIHPDSLNQKIADDKFDEFVKNTMNNIKQNEKLTNDIKQFILKESKVLNSGVQIVDGVVWVNLN